MEDKLGQLLEGFYTFKESMEDRFDGLENRFDGLENRFDMLENRFDMLENRFDMLENKVTDLEVFMIKRFDQIDFKLAKLEKQMEELTKRIGSVRRITGENMRDIEELKEKIG